MNILTMIEYSNWELGCNQVVVECDKGLDIHIGCDIRSRRKEIKGLIEYYRDIFVRKGSQLGCANVETHKIWTVDEVPVAQPYRRVVSTEVGPVKMQIQEWCRYGVIVKSKSAYSSPLVVVKKSNGDIRLCVDYRKLNAKTVRDAYPIPRVDDSLESLEGAQICSCFNLKSAYTQVRLHVKHQHKTAFSSPWGLYEFTRMPFGLVNTPATFQRIMSNLFREEIFKFWYAT